MASDPDAGSVLTYSATNLPSSLTINSTTGLITGNVTATAGMYTVTLSVHDAGNLSASTSFIITVAPVNNPPVITKPADITLSIGQAWNYQVIASDPDPGAVLTYSATNLPSSLTISSSTGLITGNVTATAGTYTVTLSVHDAGDLSASTSLIITVALVNNPPVITKPADITLNMGQAWNYQVIASDPDAGAVLTYSATNLPPSLTISSSTGLITGNVTATAGTYTVTLSVHDAGNLSASTSFIVTVAPVNNPPVITKPADITLNIGQVWNYQVIASDPDAGAVLTYSATNLPASLTISSTTGSITGNVNGAAGMYTVTLSVHDERNLSASTSFIVTIPPANRPPVIIKPADITLNAKQSWNYQVVASDPDPGAELTYSATNLPASLTIRAGTGLISGKIKAVTGTYLVTVSVKDQGNLSASTNFVITIRSGGSSTITAETDLSNNLNLDMKVVDEQIPLSSAHSLVVHENQTLEQGLYKVYPNPVGREFSVNVRVKDSSEWQFVLYSTLGYRIQLPKVQLEKGFRAVSFDISAFNLSPGLYYLIITNTLNEKKSSKIVIN
ncbi:T9SS type A sorting domain-containing protein [Flavihumibacter sp. R14]|nr:T9SS type A sorting domain-containing protein [Flavihumibacter soli]